MTRFLEYVLLVGVVFLAPLGNLSSTPQATPGTAATAPATASATAPATALLRTPLTPELPSKGKVRIPAVVIDFPDHPSVMTPAAVQDVLFGMGDVRRAPFDSLRAFYRRSSYGKLDLGGDVLGVYRALKSRDMLAREGPRAQAELVEDALRFFDNAGTDYRRYDADGDGRIDYLIVMWAGPATRGSVWWGSYTEGGSDVVVDGKRLGAYSWVGEPKDFSARTLVHETGHALGLADLYDCDPSVGPGGGVGVFDPMGSGSCDLNALSKMMLGWLRPRVVSAGTADFTLRPTSVAPDAVIVMPRYSLAAPYREFYLVQARARSGNDSVWPYRRAAVLQVWHVDAALGTDGLYRYDNSTTRHKFLSLEQADGEYEIERFDVSNASDLFGMGGLFSASSTPRSALYSGRPSGVTLCRIRRARNGVSLTASVLSNKRDGLRRVRIGDFASQQSRTAPGDQACR